MKHDLGSAIYPWDPDDHRAALACTCGVRAELRGRRADLQVLVEAMRVAHEQQRGAES